MISQITTAYCATAPQRSEARALPICGRDFVGILGQTCSESEFRSAIERTAGLNPFGHPAFMAQGVRPVAAVQSSTTDNRVANVWKPLTGGDPPAPEPLRLS